ncbi:MAG TPA: hypothetical protein PKD54_10145 [Pirellulaceae bacterium]|nr:hypothetical protein [Pirellulaceae bacterium]
MPRRRRRPAKQPQPSGDRIILRWTPRWYGLDPPLVCGEPVELIGFPDEQGVGHDDPTSAAVLSFCHRMDVPESAQRLWATILHIRHPVLGSVRTVNTIGLDYVLVLESGQHISVNAEEEPGTTSDWPEPIADWTLEVEVAGVHPQ